jgi:hypothetical protein
MPSMTQDAPFKTTKSNTVSRKREKLTKNDEKQIQPSYVIKESEPIKKEPVKRRESKAE